MLRLIVPLILLPQQSTARIIAAAVLPHGDFAYDPSMIEGKNGSLEVHAASVRVSNLMSQ